MCFQKKHSFLGLSILFFCSFLFSYFLLVVFSSYGFKTIVFSENGSEKRCIYAQKTDDLFCLDSRARITQITENTFTISGKGDLKVYVKQNNGVYDLVQHSQVTYTGPKKVAILYISTGKYIKFWEGFYQAMEKYFLPRHEKTYFLFTDHDELTVPNNVVRVHQDQLPWPYITFKRFHFFDGVKEKLKEFDYIYFLNGTMMPVAEINEEIFPTKEQSFMVTLHPGYFRVEERHLPYERSEKSQACVYENEGKYYFMGGFNGGTSEGFLKLIEVLKDWTDIDINNNVMPRWHDESMLNGYVYRKMDIGYQPLILIPIYAIPQTGHGNMDELRPFAKQLILDKAKYGGHSYLRKND